MKTTMQIQELYHKLDPKSKYFFGGFPMLENLESELENYKEYLENGLPKRQRVSIGIPIFLGTNLIGYQSSTIMRNATPTKYEREIIGTIHNLYQVQLKKIIINPKYWGKGIGGKLLQSSFRLSSRHCLDWTTDVCAENENMVSLLHKFLISKRFEWETPKGTQMIRFGK